MRILGIDPGAHTGLAFFDGGQLTELATIEPHKLERSLIEAHPAAVIYEDSRLSSHAWTTAASAKAVAIKMARNIGEIDAYCRIIVLLCGELGIAALGISPKGKGAKLNAADFESISKWQQQSNQHERDAAMVAWPYRRGLTLSHRGKNA